MKNRILCLTLIMSTLTWGTFALAVPATLGYQGRILKSDGQPLEHGSVSFVFEIAARNGTCVVYREQVTGINMLQSKGVFSVSIGQGTPSFLDSPGFKLSDAFLNHRTYNCESSGAYTPTADESRRLRVQFWDGTSWKTISPDVWIESVPYAMNAQSAQKLEDKTIADFLLKAGLPTCSAGTFLSWDGTALSCLGGGASSLPSQTGQSGKYLTTDGTTASWNTLPSATLTAGQISTALGYAPANGTNYVAKAGDIMTGSLEVPSIKVTGGTPGVGKVLTSDAAGLASWQMPSSIPVTSVAGKTGAVTLANTDISGLGTAAVKNAPSSGNASATEVVLGNDSRLTGALQSGATAGGDLSGSFPNPSVAKIQNRALDSTAPADGQVLLWDNANTIWKPQYVRMQDVRNSWGGQQMIPATACLGNQTMVWSTLTDRFTCQTITLSLSDLPTGTVTGSGTSGYLAEFSGTNTVNSSALYQASGKLGIGTTSPDALLQVNNSNNTPPDYILSLSSNTTGGAGTDAKALMRFASGNGATSRSWDVGTGLGTIFGDADNFGIMDSGMSSSSFLIQKGTGYISIGAGVPTTTLSVYSNIPSTQPQPNRAGMIIEGEGSSYGGRIATRVYSDTESPHFIAYRAMGTKALPTALTSGKSILSLMAYGYDGSGWSANSSSAGVVISAAENWATGAKGSRIVLQTTPLLSTSAQERMRIDADGKVGINTTSPSEKLEVAGNIKAVSTYTCILGNASGSVSCSSDERLKQNIKVIPDALKKVLNLRGVEFDWNGLSNAQGRHDIGVIAQEVESQFPTVVHENPVTGFKMVDYGSLVSPLIQAFKEFYAAWAHDAQIKEEKIASLTALVGTLEKDNKDLKKDLQEMKAYLCRTQSPPSFCAGN